MRDLYKNLLYLCVFCFVLFFCVHGIEMGGGEESKKDYSVVEELPTKSQTVQQHIYIYTITL